MHALTMLLTGRTGSSSRSQGGQLWVSRGLVMMSTKGVDYGQQGLVPKMQGDGSSTEPGGIMEVTMLGFDLAWV